MTGRELAAPGVRLNQTDRAAAAAVVSWAVAAWLTRTYGFWLPIGSLAIVLALVGLATGGGAMYGRARWGVGLGLGVTAGLLMTLGTVVLYDPATTLAPALRADAARLYKAFQEPGTFVELTVLPLVVVAEELVWRGLVHASLARWLTPWAAGAAGVLLYTVVLLPTGSPALVLTALAAGSCWTFLRVRGDSLTAAITAHMIWNVLVLVVQVLDLA